MDHAHLKKCELRTKGKVKLIGKVIKAVLNIDDGNRTVNISIQNENKVVPVFPSYIPQASISNPSGKDANTMHRGCH
ncbi:hypothetical protein V6N13_137456 [Hibiscus sabdariffa]|uniref:Uncharacterized protein n=1 Tax=Hibiscus sabdariffa TaxID=183260 RepID=A0ABR2DM54_9ROSI